MIKNGYINNKIVSFGYGTVKVTSAYIDEKGMLALNTNGEMCIGTSAECDAPLAAQVDEVIQSEILLEFESVKSLEVLILKLQEVRAMMLGYDIDRIDEWKRNNNITTIYHPNPMIDGQIEMVDGVKEEF